MSRKPLLTDDLINILSLVRHELVDVRGDLARCEKRLDMVHSMMALMSESLVSEPSQPEPAVAAGPNVLIVPPGMTGEALSEWRRNHDKQSREQARAALDREGAR